MNFIANYKSPFINQKSSIKSGSSSVDRALAFQAKGREFESRLPLKKKHQETGAFLFLSTSEICFEKPYYFSELSVYWL